MFIFLMVFVYTEYLYINAILCQDDVGKYMLLLKIMIKRKIKSDFFIPSFIEILLLFLPFSLL